MLAKNYIRCADGTILLKHSNSLQDQIISMDGHCFPGFPKTEGHRYIETLRLMDKNYRINNGASPTLIFFEDIFYYFKSQLSQYIPTSENDPKYDVSPEEAVALR